MGNPVLFSIVVPTFNRAQLLEKTLQSLVKQEMQDFEIIVVDDGGTDESKSVVEALADKRISYYWKENGERGAARNFGTHRASGQWINFFDSDDIAYPNHLSVALEFIKSNPETFAFHTGYDIVQEGKVISTHSYEGILNERIVARNLLSCNNVFFEKQVLQQVAFMEDRELTNAEDWLLWLKVSARYEFIGLKTVTAAIIQHDTRSMVTAGSEKMLKSARLFEKFLKADPVFQKKYGRFTNHCIAEVYSLVSLACVLEGRKKETLRWLIHSTKMDLNRIFTRRTGAILYRLVF
jgi:glycosyltransferase involved in cell wall biosynthesis